MKTQLPSRREFLGHLGRGAALCAATAFVPRLLARSRNDFEPRALILVQLEGGNDWRNTFVPHSDDYHRLRPTLALGAQARIALDETRSLSRAARGLEPLWKDGRVALVADVGIIDPSPSHYRSTEIWHTASESNEVLASGWVGRCLDELPASAAFHGTTYRPRLFAGKSNACAAALATAGEDVAVQLAEIAERAGTTKDTEFYFVSASGFDTHFAQAAMHDARLAVVSGALLALQRRLERRGVSERVLTVVFSEFGRSLAENAQGGTEHAPTGDVLFIGPAVRGGVNDLTGGTVDFRRVVATLGNDWLKVAPSPLLSRRFAGLGLLRGHS